MDINWLFYVYNLPGHGFSTKSYHRIFGRITMPAIRKYLVGAADLSEQTLKAIQVPYLSLHSAVPWSLLCEGISGISFF